MTKEELIEYGFEPKQCMIGTLYFKDSFFCKLNNDGVVDFRLVNDDMKSYGTATTLDELKDLIRKYYNETADMYDNFVQIYRMHAKSI